MSENPSAENIQAWLVSKLSERLGIEPREVDIREPLASYGLGSTEAVSLAGELAVWLKRELSPALVYEYPTIEALARYLAGSLDAAEPLSGTARTLLRETNRSRSSASAAGFPAPMFRQPSGDCCVTAWMLSARCRPTASIIAPSTIRIPQHREK